MDANPIRLIAGFSLAAGFIHAVAMVQHLDEHPLHSVFFGLAAAGQLGWGAATYRRPGAPRRLAGVAGANLAIVVIWAVSRTTGLPVGPEAGEPAAAGVMDIIATLDELAIAAIGLAILAPAARLGTVLTRLTAEQVTRAGTAIMTATVFAVMLGGHAH